MDGHRAQLWTDKVGLVGQITVRKYKLLVTFTGWIPKTFPGYKHAITTARRLPNQSSFY